MKDKIIHQKPGNNKSNYYRDVVIVESIVIVGFFVLEDIFLTVTYQGLLDLQFLIKYIDLIHLTLTGGYAVVLCILIKNHSKNKALNIFVFATLSVLFLIAIMTENPFYKFVDNNRPFYFIIQTALISIEGIVLAYAISDIFKKGKITSNHIWGAACIYLTFGISFGSIYQFVHLIQPACFGVYIPSGFGSWLECIYYSFNVLCGLEPAYPDVSHLVRNLGVIEAIGGNLYLVLLIGRILGMPGVVEK